MFFLFTFLNFYFKRYILFGDSRFYGFVTSPHFLQVEKISKNSMIHSRTQWGNFMLCCLDLWNTTVNSSRSPQPIEIETSDIKAVVFLHNYRKVIFSLTILRFNETVYVIYRNVKMGERWFQFRMSWTEVIPKKSLIFLCPSSTCLFNAVLCKWSSLDMRTQRWVFLVVFLFKRRRTWSMFISFGQEFHSYTSQGNLGPEIRQATVFVSSLSQGSA